MVLKLPVVHKQTSCFLVVYILTCGNTLALGYKKEQTYSVLVYQNISRPKILSVDAPISRCLCVPTN